MKTIYQPKGKAGEYAKYAVNFYNGCSNGCEYCYLKRGVLSKTLGGNVPMLQKKYLDEKDALRKFSKDVTANAEELRKHGLFFTFTSDPLLDETWELNIDAINVAISIGIPCTLLTKRAEWQRIYQHIPVTFRHLVAVGFTLTGHDELEPNASANEERVCAMKALHEAGFKTWASIEPIIDTESSMRMIQKVSECCDLYKVGLRSGVKKDYYDVSELKKMVDTMIVHGAVFNTPIYLKESFVKRLDCNTETLHNVFVNSKFSLFTEHEKRNSRV